MSWMKEIVYNPVKIGNKLKAILKFCLRKQSKGVVGLWEILSVSACIVALCWYTPGSLLLRCTRSLADFWLHPHQLLPLAVDTWTSQAIIYIISLYANASF